MAQLHRRFFQKLAHELRIIAPPAEAEQLHHVWLHCVTTTANALESQAAQFNKARFYEACGVTDPLLLAEA
jgi:hypothetical protein